MSYPSPASRADNGLGPIYDLELGEDVGDVIADGPGAELEPLSNLGVCQLQIQISSAAVADTESPQPRVLAGSTPTRQGQQSFAPV